MAARSATKKAESDNNAADPEFSGNKGPGTGVDAPPEEGVQMPETQVVHAESGPVYPDDAKTQVQPKHGYSESSTDDTYAAAGGRTIAGENHVRLETEDGDEVSGGDLFDEDGAAKQTVLQVFSYPNSPDREEKKLLFNKGQRVPKDQGDRIIAALDREQEPTFS